MGKEMSNWRNWPISRAWIAKNECPDCGNSLIITELIMIGEDDDTHNGICIHCRKQYSVSTAHGTLTVNIEAAEQQDRIDALEERVARLEAMVKTLTENKPISLPDTPKPEAEDETFRKKYGYLLS